MRVKKYKKKSSLKLNKRWMILTILLIVFLGWRLVSGLQKVFGVSSYLIEKSGVVEKVDDGDTFTMRGGTVVRMADFTAPSEGEAASEAAEQLRGKILGKKVWLQYDSDQNDPFGRVKASVWLGCEEEPNFGEWLEGKPAGCVKGEKIE